jgi:hypothetical protein
VDSQAGETERQMFPEKRIEKLVYLSGDTLARLPEMPLALVHAHPPHL